MLFKKSLGLVAALVAILGLATSANAEEPLTFRKVFAGMPYNMLVEAPPGTCKTMVDDNCYEVILRGSGRAYVFDAPGIGLMNVMQLEGSSLVVRDLYEETSPGVKHWPAFYADQEGFTSLVGKHKAGELFTVLSGYVFSGAMNAKMASPFLLPNGLTVPRETNLSPHTRIGTFTTHRLVVGNPNANSTMLDVTLSAMRQ